MRGRDDFSHNLVLNVMTINLNMLCTLMTSDIAIDEGIGLIIIMHEHLRRR